MRRRKERRTCFGIFSFPLPFDGFVALLCSSTSPTRAPSVLVRFFATAETPPLTRWYGAPSPRRKEEPYSGGVKKDCSGAAC